MEPISVNEINKLQEENKRIREALKEAAEYCPVVLRDQIKYEILK